MKEEIKKFLFDPTAGRITAVILVFITVIFSDKLGGLTVAPGVAAPDLKVKIKND